MRKANAAPALGTGTGHECLLLLAGMPGTIPQHPRLWGAARCCVAAGVMERPRRGMRGFAAEAEVLMSPDCPVLTCSHVSWLPLKARIAGSSFEAFKAVKKAGNTVGLLSQASIMIASRTTFWTMVKFRY